MNFNSFPRAGRLPARGGMTHVSLAALLFSLLASIVARAADDSRPPPAPAPDPAPTSQGPSAKRPTAQAQVQRTFYVQEYRVLGGRNLLPPMEVQEAVYPFLGPYRTPADVEGARGALEKAYHDKGYQTVSVQVPAQSIKSGVNILTLKVVPNEVGRLRITGSRYFSLEQLREQAPSVAEGVVPNINALSHDIVGLNQLADRRVEPVIAAGSLPNTVDVELKVKDTPPVHGSIELNNRYSTGTTELRVNGSADYDNLWQLGHTIGASFQISPENLADTQVYTGYYLARVPGVDWLSLEVTGTDQNSNVNTLGGSAVVGKGTIIGGRAIIALPGHTGFYQSLSLGIDYKHYNQNLNVGNATTVTPITYYPFSAGYSASWTGKGYSTNFNPSINLHFRGLGSTEQEFDFNRYRADGSYIYLRADLSHTRDLPEGAQAFAKIQGQVSDKPIVNSEQFSGGGLGTARGYLEAEQLGDNALFGTLELRSPSLGSFLGKAVDEWRFYLFGEGGMVAINEPLPEQIAQYNLASVGAGTNLKLLNHYNGSFDFGIPLITASTTKAFDPLMTFRVWADF